MHMGMIITGIATEGCSFPNAVILTTSGRVCPEQSRRKESMRRQMCLSSYKFPNWICVSMIARKMHAQVARKDRMDSSLRSE